MYYCRDCEQPLGDDEVVIEDEDDGFYVILCKYCRQSNVRSLPDDAPDSF
jgi:hypothetical protein